MEPIENGLSCSRWSLAMARCVGWRAYAAMFAAGVLLALAFAPFDAWPLAFVSIPLCYGFLHGAANARVATLRGFFFGYGFFMAGTWWIANALLVDADKFAWLMPVSILGLSAAMAWPFALLGWLVQRLRGPREASNLLRFAVLWMAVEYLRSAGMFGFPWNLSGYLALNSIALAQAASVVGVFGLGLLVVLLALAPRWWGCLPRRWGAFGVLLLVLPPMMWGAARLPSDAALTGTRLRLVQPAIAQSLKADREARGQVLSTLTQLSHAPTGEPLSAIVWPETALPLTLWPEQVPVVPNFASLKMPAPLITGVVTAANAQQHFQLWNSVVALSPAGEILTQYDKHQLVPFGEFVPLRSVLPLDKITPGNIDFSRGVGPQTLALEGVPAFSPLVCYEAIFPWISVDGVHRPAWLLNVTNDGWYGNSPGPYQHFAMSRMRAIEQGLPLVRAANNGISAVVDPYGRVREHLGLNARGVVDGALPAALPPTPYARYGELPVILLAGLLWIVASLLPQQLKKMTIC